MSGTYSKLITVLTGQIIAASERNNEHDNHINNCDFSGLGGYSANISQMQTNTDPYPANVESLATDGKGELERLRYQLKTQLGLTQWYQDLAVAIATFYTNVSTYRRPNLKWASITQVDVENNTGTANETKILFPDGTSRSVTEDVSSTNKYRRFDITVNAQFTTGTEDSGLRSSLSEATNTWYAMYAVKSTIDVTKFVLVGDTLLPIQANFATLNTNFGTNGWIYLGMIRNGDQAGSTGDILKFIQMGGLTNFYNISLGTIYTATGIVMATTAGATTLTYTYSAGTGGAVVPNHILLGTYSGATASVASGKFSVSDSGSNFNLVAVSMNNKEVLIPAENIALNQGVKLSNSLGSSVAMDVFLTGWMDPIVGVGSNPTL